MSNQALTWAWKQNVKGMAKFVLCTLANYADDEGHCYPGQERIAADTGQTSRSVRKQLDELEKAGLVKRSARYRRNGQRTSDAFDLITESGQRKELPVVDEATGNTCADYRKDTTDLEENLSGYSNDEPPGEPPGESNTRAREAPNERRPPANAHWKAQQEALRSATGERAYNAFIKHGTPLSDDGRSLVLAYATDFFVKWITDNHKATMERILERAITLEVRQWAGKARPRSQASNQRAA